MKRGSFVCRSIFVAAAVALGAMAQANPIVTTTFEEDIVLATDTFEDSPGTVLFSTSGVGYSDWLSPIVGADLAADPNVPVQVQSSAPLIVFASEFQFLAGQGPQYIVFGGLGPAVLDPNPIIVAGVPSITVDVVHDLAAAGPPGFVTLGTEAIAVIGQATYETGGFAPDGTLLEGTLNFDLISENIVEQSASTTPEPSALVLLVSGLAFLGFMHRRGLSSDVNAVRVHNKGCLQ
jgi:hypothetical protein